MDTRDYPNLHIDTRKGFFVCLVDGV